MLYKRAILGFRRWPVKNERLAPATGGQVWYPGVNVARCRGGRHESPGETCHCGFNAWYRIENAESNYSGVLGAVAGAGLARSHGTSGFRSAEAQVLALLDATTPYDFDIDRVAAYYGVPVFDDKYEMMDFLRDFDFENSESLKPFAGKWSVRKR